MSQRPTSDDPSRIPGLYSDPRLATRRMPCQRLLLAAHRRAAKKWQARAASAPAIADLIDLCFKRMPKDAVEYYRGGAGEGSSGISVMFMSYDERDQLTGPIHKIRKQLHILWHRWLDYFVNVLFVLVNNSTISLYPRFCKSDM
jgi:hypothetical protein